MNNQNQVNAEKTKISNVGPAVRTPLSPDSAGWSATLPGIDPTGRTEESFSRLNVAPELELSGFVPVLFAGTWEQALAVVAQLEEDDIWAVLEQGTSQSASFSTLSRGIPVLVPEECLDRASESIAQREQDNNPFHPGPSRERYEDDEFDDDGMDEDEYEDDDPFDDDVDPEDDDEDQFDYDDDEE